MLCQSASSVRASGALLLVLVAAGSTNAFAQLAGAAGLGASVPAYVGPFIVEGGATANRIGSSVSPRTTLDVASSISLPIGGGGFWLGASGFKVREVDSLPVRPLLNLGFWHDISGVTVSLGAQSHMARLGGRGPRVTTGLRPVPGVKTDSGGSTTTPTTFESYTYGDSGVASQLESWSDLEAGASWMTGRFRLGAIVGARPAIASYDMAVWGRMTAETQLTSRLSLSASVGVQPAQLQIAVPSSRFATIGLNVATWRHGEATEKGKTPSTFVVRQIEANRYRIEYRVAGAHSVEASGDFNNWVPVELHEVAPGEWQSTISIAPGTYHMNVRVDGGRWNAPPGTVEVADDFSGTVGIVVVR